MDSPGICADLPMTSKEAMFGPGFDLHHLYLLSPVVPLDTSLVHNKLNIRFDFAMHRREIMMPNVWPPTSQKIKQAHVTPTESF